MWFSLRPDQVTLVEAALTYVISRHEYALGERELQPIDMFAHEGSLCRLVEVRDIFTKLAAVGMKIEWEVKIV